MRENPLEKIVISIIKENGPMPFSKYMELCLYHPDFGYYRQKKPPIGKTGDYYTSPCVHKIFGHVIAKSIIEIFKELELDDPYLIEAGAGNGYLLRDIGEYLSNNHPEIIKRLNLIIIEPHLPYREIQEKEASKFFKKIFFLDYPSQLPSFDGIFYSNELFDSMPVEILQSDLNGNINQVYVDYQDESFVELLLPIDDYVYGYLKKWQISIPSNFRTEISLISENFYNEISKKLRKGAIITIDYGYPRKELLSEKHNRGTLMCYFRHTALENPYIRLGNQDITYHIDFTLLKDIGELNGLNTAGFVDQYYFLMGTGIIEEVEKLKKENFEEYQQEIIKIKNLLMPGGMGEIFKVLVQTKKLNYIPKGFSFRNRKNQL